MTAEVQAITPEERSALLGYAVLRANFDHNAPSYLDNFTAFVLDVLAEGYPQEQDESHIGHAIRATFGLTMPDGVVRRLLKKLISSGKASRTAGGMYRIADDARVDLESLRTRMAEFLAKLSELEMKFVDFVRSHHPESLELVDDDPAFILQEFIESHAAPLLRRGVAGQRDGAANWGELHGAEYLVGSYVLHLEARDAVTFGYLIDAVKGAILAGVLAVGPGDLHQKLDNLTLVLDTPVLLSALGYRGDLPKRATAQMLELARAQDVKLVCFEHTEKEMSGVLDAAIAGLRGRSRAIDLMRSVDLHFRDIDATAADIVIEQANLRENLQGLGIRIVSRPDDYYRYGLDEERLEDSLKAALPTQREQTRLYDLQSLSAVHRLRHGGSPNSLERCGYLFVTDNYGLTLVAKKVDERHQWPLAMLDGEVASLLWVRAPAVADDLPRQQLMAAVYTGMQPPAHLWMKYVEEIERLESKGSINPAEAIVLRSRPEARNALMDVTLGDSERMNSDSVAVVVSRVRDQLVAPYQVEAREAYAAKEQADARATAEANRDRETLERQLAELSSQLGAMRDQESNRDERIRRRAAKRARRIVASAVLIAAMLLIVPLLLKTFVPTAMKHMPSLVAWLASAAGIIVFALAAVALFFGGTVRDWAAPLEGRLASRIEGRMRRDAGLPTGDN